MKAILWELIDENKKIIKCNLCARRCLIPNNSKGFCLVRKNENGTLKAIYYGKIIAENVDPIEKKPLFHFYPSHLSYSIALPSCNFACEFCCNYQISQCLRENFPFFVLEREPEEIVESAIKQNCFSISYTYTEPTIHIEFAKDVGKLARKKGLKNIFVTNGYLTPEAVKEISKFLDAATVDVKGNGDDEFYKKLMKVPSSQPIFDALLEMKRRKIHIEITDLVFPKYGDSIEKAKKLVKWIVDNLGPETPLHFIQFFPSYKILDLPRTPIETLEKHAKIAKEEGLKFVYIGNVPGHPLENTYCPNCGKAVIKRYSIYVLEWNLDDKNRCKYCKTKISITGKLSKNEMD